MKIPKIMVVGDVMLDHYIVGTVDRVSPESGVPVFQESNYGTENWFTLGGAANIANNISSVGADVYLVGVCGPNYDDMMQKFLRESKIRSFVRPSHSTTIKRRFLTKEGKHIFRYDKEDIPDHSYISSFLPKDPPEDLDIVVVADYAKGAIDEKVMEILRSYNVPIIVDPKPVNTHLYKGVYMVCPNQKEWDEMMLSDFDEIGCNILITMGNDGMQLLKDGNTIDLPSNPIKVVDVCGAGDTVTAIMAVCMAMGKNELQSARTALKCAEYVITQPGTVPVTKEVFERNLV